MKNFVKENWYKLMIGCSMFIFSVSALIYSVAPARAEGTLKKKNIDGVMFYVVDSQNRVWGHNPYNGTNVWEIVATLK